MVSPSFVAELNARQNFPRYRWTDRFRAGHTKQLGSPQNLSLYVILYLFLRRRRCAAVTGKALEKDCAFHGSAIKHANLASLGHFASGCPSPRAGHITLGVPRLVYVNQVGDLVTQRS
jgi:hypothetical protein